MTLRTPLAFALTLVFTQAACGGSGTTSTDDGGSADLATASPGPDMAGGGQCMPKDPPCTDNQIQDVSLFKKASTRKITNEADGATAGAWISTVDATGGGFTPSESFVYAKFTESGLTRVDVGDTAAFASSDWDIAFRRFLVRLNSGVSGPGCVLGAETSSDYDALQKLPAGLDFQAESYYDDKCTLVPDNSGLGTAKTVLSTFWVYEQCVKMTGQVYVIQLADGRHVKLTVTSYYAPDAQKTCNDTGSVPANTVGGTVKVRWQVLP